LLYEDESFAYPPLRSLVLEIFMNRLRFLHIPKTAGTTFTNCLADQYFRKWHFAFTGAHPSDINRLTNLPEAKRQKIELFTGHAPIMTGIDLVDHAKMITFLREPISRVKSFIQHISEGKSPEYLKGPFDLDSFLESGVEDLSNLQTKMLINKGASYSRSLINTMSKSEAKDRALYNLLHVVAGFGIQEYFDESLILFAKLLRTYP
jgi:Sulfotransferase family